MKNEIFVLAHEMKNPLTVAKGYLGMLNKNNLEDYKDIIKEQINISLEIIDNYLEYNKLQVNLEEIDLNLLLMDIRNSFKDYLKKKGISLKIHYLDDEIYLQADYNKLKQVIYNIIKNSMESHSKKIDISYKIIYNTIEICIKNDGDSCLDINKIGKNYSNKVLGNGIGTTLSKKIIELHHGKIKFINNKEKGISTIITLPLE